MSSATFVSTEATESFEPEHRKHEPQQPIATAHAAMQNPNLPPLIRTTTGWAPQAPKTIADTGLDPWVVHDLALKLTATVPHLTTEWAADQLRLPTDLVEKLFWQLKEDQLVEILGQTGEFGYRYAATGRGRDQAKRSMEVSGYVGPCPVSLNAYTAMLDWQTSNRPKAAFDDVRGAISGLVLPETTVEVAALAARSARSLFLFGPAGNGKTSLGRALHNAVQGELWIPFCFNLESSIVRVYDRQIHKPLDGDPNQENPNPFGKDSRVDRRWMRIKPPFVVAGGEMTIAELDLSYSPSLRYYEAPPHVKANGGTFLIDDFGRQRIEPHELLNRWIIPLESRIDHLTLAAGQKIEVPFRLLLIVATNLSINEVCDPAFLRRMGYRVLIDKPDSQTYITIFQRYAQQTGAPIEPGLLERLLQRYTDENRELRASEPRDLIERAREICDMRQRPLALTADVMNTAWLAYFGNSATLPK